MSSVTKPNHNLSLHLLETNSLTYSLLFPFQCSHPFKYNLFSPSHSPITHYCFNVSPFSLKTPFSTKMGSKWRKVKLAIGINTCVQVPNTIDNSSSDRVSPSSDRRSATSTTSSSGVRLSRSKSSKVCIAL